MTIYMDIYIYIYIQTVGIKYFNDHSKHVSLVTNTRGCVATHPQRPVELLCNIPQQYFFSIGCSNDSFEYTCRLPGSND